MIKPRRPIRWLRRSTVFGATILNLWPFVGGANAASLADAVALAYRTNPSLQIQRSQLRAIDESYVQAFSAYRPNVSLAVQGQYTYQGEQSQFTGVTVGAETNTLTTGISATQILYNGGRTAAQVSTAEANILSTREALRQVEGTTLLTVIEAYAAVIRDDRILAAQRFAVDSFQAQVSEIEARLKVGDVTKTDLEQAESQLASGRSALAAAQGTLESSRAAYVAVVGENPGQLEALPPLPGLPVDIDEAFDAAGDDSPVILQAVLNERAAKAQVREEKAQNMPSLNAQIFYGFAGTAVPYVSRTFYRDVVGTVNLSVPIFTGGLNSSKIRQAQEQDVTTRLQIDQARRTVVESVAQAWNSDNAALRSVVADQAALETAAGSAKGMQIEYKAGIRSTLEVLTEEERLEAAQVAVATDQYNAYTAQASLLNVIGRLEAIDFTTGVPLYNDKRNLNKVKGIGATPLDEPIAAIDHIAEPAAGPVKPIQTPPLAAAPKIAAAAAQPIVAFSDFSPPDPKLQGVAGSPVGAGSLWLVVADGGGFRIAAAADGVACKAGMCADWEITRYTQARPDGVAIVQDRAEYDCVNRRTRTVEEVHLTSDGQPLNRIDGATAWTPVAPGAARDAQLSFACHVLDLRAASPPNTDRLAIGAFRFSHISASDAQAFVPTPAALSGAKGGAAHRFVVQFAASANRQDADRINHQVEQQLGGAVQGVDFEIQTAEVNGQTFYRSIISSFSAPEPARALCVKIRSNGRSCLVRRD